MYMLHVSASCIRNSGYDLSHSMCLGKDESLDCRERNCDASVSDDTKSVKKWFNLILQGVNFAMCLTFRNLILLGQFI